MTRREDVHNESTQEERRQVLKDTGTFHSHADSGSAGGRYGGRHPNAR